jgi:hypothetical protein
MLYSRIGTGLLLAGALSACAAIDSTVDPRYDTVNRSLAKLRNEAILLNIVRASHQYPLNFAAIGKVSPGMSNVTSIGLPSFLAGPNPRCVNLANTGVIGAAGAAACLVAPASPARDVVFGNNTLNDQFNMNYNYDISTQETQDFYNGLLGPVGLSELIFFLRQGYPRELLFWLFADSFEIGPLGYQYDPPESYGCPAHEPKHRCFREFVELAVITGLTAEQKILRHDSSGKIETLVYFRFCFNQALAIRGQEAMDPDRLRVIKAKYTDRGARLNPYCGDPTWNPEQPPAAPAAKPAAGPPAAPAATPAAAPAAALVAAPPAGQQGQPEKQTTSFVIPGETDTLVVQLGPYQFKIVTRSAFGMYQFLGKLMKQSIEGAPEVLPPGTPADEVWPTLSTVHDDKDLIKVVKGSSDCFVHTIFIDGDYCVPEEGSNNTKRIFSILAQLIALKTAAGDLAITPTVRALPTQ